MDRGAGDDTHLPETATGLKKMLWQESLFTLG